METFNSFKIYTDDSDDAVDVVARILKEHGVRSFTITPAFGYYDGEGRASLIVDILGSVSAPVSRLTVYDAAREIRRALEQEAVLVTETETDVYEVVQASDLEDQQPSEYIPEGRPVIGDGS